MFLVNLTISLILLFSFFNGLTYSQESQDVSCHTCLHIEFKLSNLPPQYRHMIEALLSSMRLSNPACVKGQVKAISCGTPTFPNVNKCQTTTVKLRAVGMKKIFDTAVMEATVVVRGCIAQLAGKKDRCIDFNEMDEQTRAKMTEKLQRLENQWNNATYSGKMCIGASADAKTTSVKPTESPLTTKAFEAGSGVTTVSPDNRSTTQTVTPDNKTANMSTSVAPDNQTGNTSIVVTPGDRNGMANSQSKKDGPSNRSGILSSSSVLFLLFILFLKDCMIFS